MGSLVNCQTLGYTRRRSEGKRWKKKYVSLNLVYPHWANLRGNREIGHARAYDDLLDDRARHHRIDHRRRRYPHVFAPDHERYHPAGLIFSTLGAILVLFICYKLKIHFPQVNPF